MTTINSWKWRRRDGNHLITQVNVKGAVRKSCHDLGLAPENLIEKSLNYTLALNLEFQGLIITIKNTEFVTVFSKGELKNLLGWDGTFFVKFKLQMYHTKRKHYEIEREI